MSCCQGRSPSSGHTTWTDPGDLPPPPDRTARPYVYVLLHCSHYSAAGIESSSARALASYAPVAWVWRPDTVKKSMYCPLPMAAEARGGTDDTRNESHEVHGLATSPR